MGTNKASNEAVFVKTRLLAMRIQRSPGSSIRIRWSPYLKRIVPHTIWDHAADWKTGYHTIFGDHIERCLNAVRLLAQANTGRSESLKW